MVAVSQNITDQSMSNHTMVCAPPAFQVQIVPFGDAYAVGVYDSDPREGVYSSQQGAYRGYLEQSLTKDGFRFDFVGTKRQKGITGPQDIDHYGWYGLSLGKLASEAVFNMQFFEDQYKRPNIVLFSASVIDALSNNSEPGMTQSLNELVDGTMSRLNNPIMLLATMPPIKDPRVKIQQSRAAYNQATKTVVSQQAAKGRKIYLVDVAAVLTTSNSDDNFLPSESEYSTMASLFHQGICNALASTSSTPAPPTSTPTLVPPTSTPVTPSPTSPSGQTTPAPASTNTSYLYIALLANALPGPPPEPATATPIPTPDPCLSQDCRESNNSFNEAQPINIGERVLASLKGVAPNEDLRDFYKIQLQAGKSYTIQLKSTGNLDLDLYLYDAPNNDAKVASSARRDNSNEKIPYETGPDSSMHYILVLVNQINNSRQQYELIVTE